MESDLLLLNIKYTSLGGQTELEVIDSLEVKGEVKQFDVDLERNLFFVVLDDGITVYR